MGWMTLMINHDMENLEKRRDRLAGYVLLAMLAVSIVGAWWFWR